jgi:XTP/dITP diphosphohydrolase
MLFATTNPGKVDEVQPHLRKYSIHVSPLGDTYPEDPEVEETGDTFQENASIKALHYNRKYNVPALADDSGLVIPALDNQPGVHSSRFMGENTSYEKKMSAILEMLSEKPDADRTAYFACSMVFAMDGRVVCSFEKKVFGLIAEEMKGEGGFGYDPIFLYPELGKTFAEINRDLKNTISHRGKAASTFVALIETHPMMASLLQS